MRYLFTIFIFLNFCTSQNNDIKKNKKIVKDKIKTENENTHPKSSVVKSGTNDLLNEIKLVRNEIFARYGRIFKTQKYKSFFSQFKWYKPNENFNDSLLTEDDLRDIKILKTYEDSLIFLNKSETNTIKTALYLIKQLRYTKIDTTIFSFGYINSDNKIDTVKTNIKLLNNKISVIYSWEQKDSLIWEYKFIDPYLWVSDSKLFEYGTRDLWISFAIAIKHCLFEFKNKADYESISDEIAASIAHYFDRSIEEKQFLQYIKFSTKNIVLYAQDESGGNLDFWYEPLIKFVPYYRP